MSNPMPLTIGYDNRPANKIAKLFFNFSQRHIPAHPRMSTADFHAFTIHAQQATEIVHDAICLSFHKRRQRSVWMDTVTGNTFTLKLVDGKLECISALFPAQPTHLLVEDITLQSKTHPVVTIGGDPQTRELRDFFALFSEDPTYADGYCIGDKVHVAGYYSDCRITNILDTSIGIFFTCTPADSIFPPYTCRESRLQKVS